MVSFDSVETRRRLLRRLPDIIIIALMLIGIGYFLVRPLFEHRHAAVAPDFSAPTLAGGRVSLQHEHGRMLVLDFFATWCDPCRQSLPYIERFAAGNPDVTVIAVNAGESPAVIAPFARQFRMNAKLLALDEHQALVHRFGVTGLPTIIGIDGTGKIRNIWYGFTPQITEILQAAKQRYQAR